MKFKFIIFIGLFWSHKGHKWAPNEVFQVQKINALSRLKIHCNEKVYIQWKNLVLSFCAKRDPKWKFKFYGKLMYWFFKIFLWSCSSTKAENWVKLFWLNSCFGIFETKRPQNGLEMRLSFLSKLKHDIYLFFARNYSNIWQLEIAINSCCFRKDLVFFQLKWS